MALCNRIMVRNEKIWLARKARASKAYGPFALTKFEMTPDRYEPLKIVRLFWGQWRFYGA